jgi:hypothetical protein
MDVIPPEIKNKAILNELLSFLEVVIHCILRIRGVYPAQLFKSVQKYDLLTWMSRHPDLNEYIHSLLEDTREWWKKGLMEKINLVISDEISGQIIEEYCFRLYDYIPKDADDVIDETIIPENASSRERGMAKRKKVELQIINLRSHLKRLLCLVMRSDGDCSPIRDKCTFSLLVSTCEIQDSNEPTADNLGVTSWEQIPKPKFPNAKHTPIGTVNSDPICLSLDVHALPRSSSSITR